MAPVRKKLQVMSVTEAAAGRIREIMAKADPAVQGLRVAVSKGGCAGMSYQVDFATEIKAGDEVIEDKGVRVVIDPTAVLFLLGTEMDYKVDKLAAQFVFNNPNQTSACGCGESVAITPVSPVAAH